MEIEQPKNQFDIFEKDIENLLGASVTITPAEQDGYSTSHNKVSNALIGQEITQFYQDNEPIRVILDRKASEERKATYIYILGDENTLLSRDIRITSDDIDIIDVIGSIYDTHSINGGPVEIKQQHLMNISDGLLVTNVRKDEQKEKFDRVRDLSTINIRLNTEKHMEWNKASKKKKQTIKATYQGHLLPIETLEVDGNYTIKINAAPILYRYAKDAGQQKYYSRDDRDLKFIRNTDENGNIVEKKTSIKRLSPLTKTINHYMLSTIIPSLNNNTYQEYTYETLYKYINRDLPKLDISKNKARVNKTIEEILFTNQQKEFFKRYEIIKRGKNLYKIRIFSNTSETHKRTKRV